MLKSLPFQVKNGSPVFFSQEAREQFSCYKENQVVLGDFRGTTKERSIIQLRLYWGCCNHVALNVREYPFRHKNYEHYIRWSQKELVDKQLRKALHFVDDRLTVRINPEAFEFHYRSIAVKNLKHIEACDYFNRAFDLMAIRIGLDSRETLIKNVKS